MADSPVLVLEEQNTAGAQDTYDNRLEEDRKANSNRDKVDVFVGQLTASFQTTFYQSGSLATHLGNSEVYGGAVVASENRVITEVNVVMSATGTTGISTFDVNVQESASAIPSTIFITDDVRPHLSANLVGSSLWAISSTKTFVTSSWGAGRALTVNVQESATNASDATVVVHWKPSGSYA